MNMDLERRGILVFEQLLSRVTGRRKECECQGPPTIFKYTGMLESSVNLKNINIIKLLYPICIALTLGLMKLTAKQVGLLKIDF